MSVAKNAPNVSLQPARNCRKHHRALALLAAALQSGHFARKLVGATTRLFAGGQAWQFEGSRRSYVVASWGVCQQPRLFATTSWASTPFEATVQSAVKALIARGYTGGQVMTK